MQDHLKEAFLFKILATGILVLKVEENYTQLIIQENSTRLILKKIKDKLK